MSVVFVGAVVIASSGHSVAQPNPCSRTSSQAGEQAIAEARLQLAGMGEGGMGGTGDPEDMGGMKSMGGGHGDTGGHGTSGGTPQPHASPGTSDSQMRKHMDEMHEHMKDMHPATGSQPDKGGAGSPGGGGGGQGSDRE